VSNLDDLMAPDELMAAQDDLREFARRTRVIASAFEGSENARLLAVANDLDQEVGDLEVRL
jgi:hypothetical protein